ncbi:hypothetical protein JVU11DRAFT_7028 [Chiua virens]|nr:hypothetical protein JVU11DRAFT_7028 [Chiua virens]
MEWSHPEVRLCLSVWKSEMISKKHYSGFKQSWIMNKSEEKYSKHKTKEEISDEVSLLPWAETPGLAQHHLPRFPFLL